VDIASPNGWNEYATVSRHEVLDMVVSRTFNAPQERVWRAWSDPDEVMKWWGRKASPR
jgi:uncharacterized protein YndB with AHSA1/START domain